LKLRITNLHPLAHSYVLMYAILLYQQSFMIYLHRSVHQPLQGYGFLGMLTSSFTGRELMFQVGTALRGRLVVKQGIKSLYLFTYSLFILKHILFILKLKKFRGPEKTSRHWAQSCSCYVTCYLTSETWSVHQAVRLQPKCMVQAILSPTHRKKTKIWVCVHSGVHGWRLSQLPILTLVLQSSHLGTWYTAHCLWLICCPHAHICFPWKWMCTLGLCADRRFRQDWGMYLYLGIPWMKASEFLKRLSKTYIHPASHFSEWEIESQVS